MRKYMSSYEEMVYKLLVKNKIEFRTEVTFPDLHKKNLLRFDFGVYKNDKLLCLIEVDGEQHFRQTFGGRSEFMRCKAYDRFKNKYCIDKKIPLIRVPYYDINLLTVHSLFNNHAYRVTSEFHNDNIINK